ncbi:hypothetical protein C7M84_010419 [Penaeus vannamei]|uniref:Uncharacterized protein n=1 Tax=Penaeus vannamei TaxID=6689 RepID=A0A3R7PGT2_PENVA|nr:hypothetical protein C7M84_010419 [Penaeus vannamei]
MTHKTLTPDMGGTDVNRRKLSLLCLDVQQEVTSAAVSYLLLSLSLSLLLSLSLSLLSLSLSLILLSSPLFSSRSLVSLSLVFPSLSYPPPSLHSPRSLSPTLSSLSSPPLLSLSPFPHILGGGVKRSALSRPLLVSLLPPLSSLPPLSLLLLSLSSLLFTPHRGPPPSLSFFPLITRTPLPPLSPLSASVPPTPLSSSTFLSPSSLLLSSAPLSSSSPPSLSRLSSLSPLARSHPLCVLSLPWGFLRLSPACSSLSLTPLSCVSLLLPSLRLSSVSICARLVSLDLPLRVPPSSVLSSPPAICTFQSTPYWQKPTVIIHVLAVASNNAQVPTPTTAHFHRPRSIAVLASTMTIPPPLTSTNPRSPPTAPILPSTHISSPKHRPYRPSPRSRSARQLSLSPKTTHQLPQHPHPRFLSPNPRTRSFPTQSNRGAPLSRHSPARPLFVGGDTRPRNEITRDPSHSAPPAPLVASNNKCYRRGTSPEKNFADDKVRASLPVCLLCVTSVSAMPVFAGRSILALMALPVMLGVCAAPGDKGSSQLLAHEVVDCLFHFGFFSSVLP